MSVPVRTAARIESPDGSAWVEFFPMEVFYWLEPERFRSQTPVGSRSLGMIYLPGVLGHHSHTARVNAEAIRCCSRAGIRRLLAIFDHCRTTA